MKCARLNYHIPALKLTTLTPSIKLTEPSANLSHTFKLPSHILTLILYHPHALTPRTLSLTFSTISNLQP